MAVKLTPELETLHDQVHKSLGIDPRTPAYPHLSLCYITDKDAENGERQKFYDGLHLRKDGNGIALDCGDGGGAEDWLSEFIIKEIWVVSCEGLVEEWKVLDIVELQS
ncbi:hypothetical protein AMATHDRAFT_53152 [Amanita thiersii Skay4041]|uniref:Uncharacterized protein n=1 Tax=Amanita thiersii Skay4041 TaxID=703135 RepID=A0A2A9P0Y0_9AGAR|nr:hypothetical protein AMATHDRAFT_53152 [Amanita thiersii Skay4041]